MKQVFINKLIELEFVKFGLFQLKSGKQSNIYFDIRNSLMETINELENRGLIIEKILIVLDRQEGGIDLLKEKGYNVESILTKEELLLNLN